MKAHEFIHEMQTTSAILGRTSGISVVFEGNEARTDGKTIWLPALPSEAELTQEQVLAMRGFVDHEAGHNRHSDMERIISFYDKNRNNERDDLSRLHNALEDVFMERKVLDEYPGSWKNLRQTHEMVRQREYGIASKFSDEEMKEFLSDPSESTSAAIAYNKGEDYITEHNEKMREFLPESLDKMGKHYSKLALECETSSDVIELAKKIYQYNQETPQEEQTPEDFDDKAESGELSDMEGEENEGENSPGFSTAKSEGQAEAEARQGRSGEGEGKDKLSEASQDMGEILTSEEEYDHGGGGIGSCMDNGLRGGYRVATTAGDKTYRRGGKSTEGGRPHITEVVEDTQHTTDYDKRKTELKADVMVMKNKLRRSLLARQQRDWDFGRERGRLDSKRLVAASQGVRQVYKRRTDRLDEDTAISILVDLSGSMHGRKAEVARDCAIALSECFEGTQMSYRISGFCNGGTHPSANNVSGQYHRYERLDHPIFKDYDDALRVTRGSVYLIPEAVGGNNSDYDFVNKELYVLSQRTEKRKVLFVLSDGHVACHSDAPDSEHERLIRESLKHYKTKSGVESVGIGICSNAVEAIYPDQVVVNNVNELSSTVFNKLTDVLFREVK